MDVGGWLRGLGLGQYEEKFRDNRIDADLLPRLTVDESRTSASLLLVIGEGCSTQSPRWPPQSRGGRPCFPVKASAQKGSPSLG
jgi:hypothetical protein